MIEKSLAETLWCPFVTAPSALIEEAVDGAVEDHSSSGLQVSRLRTQYETHGTMIAVAGINRIDGNLPYEKTLCKTEKCEWWRRGGTSSDGFCSRLDDNIERFASGMPDDAGMKARGCPHALAIVVFKKDWTDTNGMLSGKTVAALGANRGEDGEFLADCLCITNKCMAYYARTADKGHCMAADKRMQRF